MRLGLPGGAQRPINGPIALARHEQLFGGELGDHLAAIGGHHYLFFDPGRRPPVRSRPVGLQGKHHALLQHLRVVQRHQSAENGLFPDGQPDPVPVLQSEGGQFVRETKLRSFGPHLDDVSRCGSGFYPGDGLVDERPAALVGVTLGDTGAAYGKRAVVAGPVAVERVQDVEEGRVARAKDAVAVNMGMR